MTYHYWKHLIVLLIAVPAMQVLSAPGQHLCGTALSRAWTTNYTLRALVAEMELSLIESLGTPGKPSLMRMEPHEALANLTRGLDDQEEQLAAIARDWKPPSSDGYFFECMAVGAVLSVLLTLLFSWNKDMELARTKQERMRELAR